MKNTMKENEEILTIDGLNQKIDDYNRRLRNLEVSI